MDGICTDDVKQLMEDVAPLALFDATVTIQELLKNAEMMSHLSSVLNDVVPFLSQSIMSLWLCRFLHSSLTALSSGNVLESLFSFIRSLVKYARWTLEISPAAADNDRGDFSPPRKRLRRFYPSSPTESHTSFEPLGHDRQAEMHPRTPSAVIFLTKFCAEIFSRLVHFEDQLHFNALELLLSVPDCCISCQMRVDVCK